MKYMGDEQGDEQDDFSVSNLFLFINYWGGSYSLYFLYFYPDPFIHTV